MRVVMFGLAALSAAMVVAGALAPWQFFAQGVPETGTGAGVVNLFGVLLISLFGFTAGWVGLCICVAWLARPHA